MFVRIFVLLNVDITVRYVIFMTISSYDEAGGTYILVSVFCQNQCFIHPRVWGIVVVPVPGEFDSVLRVSFLRVCITYL